MLRNVGFRGHPFDAHLHFGMFVSEAPDDFAAVYSDEYFSFGEARYRQLELLPASRAHAVNPYPYLVAWYRAEHPGVGG